MRICGRVPAGKGCSAELMIARDNEPECQPRASLVITMRKNLLTFLDDCRKHGSQTALAHRRGLRVSRWSYARLRSTAFQFARELEARNISKAERVLFWAESSPEWVACFFGCLLRGVIVVPLDFESSPAFATRVQLP